MANRGKETGHLVLPGGQELTPASYLVSVPVFSPREIDDRLNVLGYRGQEEARRRVCLCAYRHVKRLRSIYLEKMSRSMVPNRSNALIIGPTGCGKTYIIELLFGEILKLPCVITEMTKYTESGYVGDDVVNIINQLIDAAHGRVDVAQCGIVALDEFDKIAGSVSNLAFRGSGTNKDVSGYGVQRELLKILEGADIIVPRDYRMTCYSVRDEISTRDITFFALGAFSGFVGDGFGTKNVGFKPGPADTAAGKISYSLEEGQAENVYNFQNYGFLPELIARFTYVVPFKPLDSETLMKILEIRVHNYEQEFRSEGIELRIEDDVRALIVDDALKKETGA
ncbi:AAA family ATPase, partial [candidate division WOR-3 bacterium]|nr:AAA family ATPase [candidate division WOR-3 bacterium]